MKNEEDRVEGDNRESKQWRKLKVGKKNNVKKQKQNRTTKYLLRKKCRETGIKMNTLLKQNTKFATHRQSVCIQGDM